MPSSRVAPVVSAAVTLLLAVVAVLGGLLPASASAPPHRAAEDTPSPRVVLVGTTGVRWDDVHTLSTPALWGLSREGSLGTVAARSARSYSCPADGWLAVSAGARAADLPGTGYGECRTLELPDDGGPVPGWSSYTRSAEGSAFRPSLGLLGTTLRDEGVPSVGFGPGAAVALADDDGRPVGAVSALPDGPRALRTAVRAALEDARFVVVDVGSVRDIGRSTVARGEDGAAVGPDGVAGTPDDLAVTEPDPTGEAPAGPEVIAEPTRAQQLQPVDERIGAVLAAAESAGDDVTVLVVSLADSGTRARLQLAGALGPAPDGARYGTSLLGSRSTRQDGIVQATDVTPTLVRLLDVVDAVPGGALVGSPVVPVPGPASAIARLDAVVDLDTHSAAVRSVTPRAYTWLIVVNLLLQAAVVVGLNGRVIRRGKDLLARLRRREVVPPSVTGPSSLASTDPSTARRTLVTLRTAGVAVAALPVATTLANALPWWRVPARGWAVTALVLAWIGVVTAAALLPRWGRTVLGPTAVVSGVTVLVLGLDVATGAVLQVSGPMGVQPVVAGRFYGMNNTSFALFAASALLLAAALADPLVRAGRRRTAAVLVAVIGVVVTVLDGTPGLGSDFGGPPALVPGFAVLTLLAAGLRLSWGRLVLVLAAGAAVVTGFVVLDWLRPADQRTHLGRFAQTVLDGGLVDVVSRKLAQNLANLGGSWLTLLAVGGIALVALVLLRPLRRAAAAPDGEDYGWLSSGAPLAPPAWAAPMLRPAVVALGVTLGIGFLVNDSGILVPALGISVAVPLLVAACAAWLLQDRSAPVPDEPVPATQDAYDA